MFQKLLTFGELSFLESLKPTDAKGLAGVTAKLFGLPLDKRDRISDWGRRPLREEQIIYAALDAHVLIEIYHKIK